MPLSELLVGFKKQIRLPKVIISNQTLSLEFLILDDFLLKTATRQNQKRIKFFIFILRDEHILEKNKAHLNKFLFGNIITVNFCLLKLFALINTFDLIFWNGFKVRLL